MKDKYVKFNGGWGDRCVDIIKEVVEIATKTQQTQIYEMNGVDLAIRPNANLEDEIKFFQKCQEVNGDRYHYEQQEYQKTDEYKEKVAKQIAKENAIKKEISELTEVFAIAAGTETEYAKYVEINSVNGYSRGVVDYAELWARLMQKELAGGKTIIECADETSHKADTDGITGFMYGAAVSALSKFWKHGEELRKWHNKEYGHEGDGVVNPAVLTISTKE